MLALLLLLLLLSSPPAGAWYKHVASPRYHTVGRAAGLLMGLRRSPYMWRRALRPAAGSLAWDTRGLGEFPQGLSAKDTLSPAPVLRGALLLSSGVRELLEMGRRYSRAGLRVSAPRSQRAAEPEPELEPQLGTPSWTSVKQARYVGRERGPGRQWVEDVGRDLGPEPRAHETPYNLPTSHFLPRKAFYPSSLGEGRGLVVGAQPSSQGPALFSLEPSECLLFSQGLRSEPPSPALTSPQGHPECSPCWRRPVV